MDFRARAKTGLRRLHWTRGLRAGLSVAVAMVICRMLKQPMGWAALGGFDAVLVDNGGPYWSRLKTMATVLVGGAAACIVGSLAPHALLPAALITAAFCFLVTFARVLAQPIAGTGVIILVIYFAGYGASQRVVSGVLVNASLFVLGGLWATALSLILWPFDPFRPARLSLATCYGALAEAAAAIQAASELHPEGEGGRAADQEWKRHLRQHLEAARAALGATSGRAPSRTVRARSLTVLLETADMLFAVVSRMAELADVVQDEPSRRAVADRARFVGHEMQSVREGLAQRPEDSGSSFAPEGSRSVERVRRQAALSLNREPAQGFMAHLLADEAEALQDVEVAFEAVRAVWNGVEPMASRQRQWLWAQGSVRARLHRVLNGLGDALSANWTLNSVMMRHALRVAVVAIVDVGVMRIVHITHGFWLATTSIIVLQPQATGTLRKSAQRVGGTIAGGVLAAALAAGIRDEAGIIAAITICSVLTLATYAVDYGWYCFFLTPTFVLMSLPHLQDWRYAGVRMAMTVVGALVSVLAMRLLWPEREEVELGRLLERGAAAAAAYVRAMLDFWATPEEAKRVAERVVLAPARRACGLTSNDAEEALDRLMQEPGLGRRKDRVREHALTFTTYLRRLTQTITTLAVTGADGKGSKARMEALAGRLRRIAGQPGETAGRREEGGGNTFAEQQMRRMERQVEVLERARQGMSGQGQGQESGKKTWSERA